MGPGGMMGSGASAAGRTVVGDAARPEAAAAAATVGVAAAAATVGEVVVAAAGAMGEPAWGPGPVATGGAGGGGAANAV